MALIGTSRWSFGLPTNGLLVLLWPRPRTKAFLCVDIATVALSSLSYRVLLSFIFKGASSANDKHHWHSDCVNGASIMYAQATYGRPISRTSLRSSLENAPSAQQIIPLTDAHAQPIRYINVHSVPIAIVPHRTPNFEDDNTRPHSLP